MIRTFLFPLVATVGLVAGCSNQSSPEPPPSAPTNQTPADLSSFYSQSITWNSCDRGMCATIKVPLDYSQPQADSIEIEVFKRPASDVNGRLGSIVVNPGGPGGSGVEFARSASILMSKTLLTKFDIVGFDPRGVGKSTPIECLSDQQTDALLSNLGAPQSQTQFDQSVAVAASVGQTCQANSPRLTPAIGTVPAAKDMDIMRQLLGEAKLNFFGMSYGSFLGLTYAELFTGNVGRFVLDGVIDPTLSNEQLARGQAEGFQLAFNRFIQDCAKHPDCPLPKGQAKGLQRVDQWLKSLGNQPIPAAPGRPLTKPLALTGIVSSLYEPETGWPTLRTALADGFRGEGRTMLEIVDEFTVREPDGHFADNSIDALYAVNCLDRPDRADPARTAELATEWSSTAPTFGPDLAWSNLPCYNWPAPATDMPHAITAAGAPTIVLIGSRYDPATPYQWAVAVNQQLADSVLISSGQEGHTGAFRTKCVDNAIDRAFTEATIPNTPITCK